MHISYIHIKYILSLLLNHLT
ncbi:hypothetical protein F383_34674 [Gossypium arboreum]|uniref:Uncharacterized protein n=1 Tax=Gossypium arboreum TaxID=29729 RepID=A0A0B0N4E4_GOSAR|nr:hypothetical protein F383_34674 [Gossypium arboreum]